MLPGLPQHDGFGHRKQRNVHLSAIPGQSLCVHRYFHGAGSAVRGWLRPVAPFVVWLGRRAVFHAGFRPADIRDLRGCDPLCLSGPGPGRKTGGQSVTRRRKPGLNILA